MLSKSTVAIDDVLRRRIKKMAAFLDIPQGEVIKRAIDEFEFKFLRQNQEELKKPLQENLGFDQNIDVEALYQAATEKIWAKDPITKKIQQQLAQGSETIDDFTITRWNVGLDV